MYMYIQAHLTHTLVHYSYSTMYIHVHAQDAENYTIDSSLTATN